VSDNSQELIQRAGQGDSVAMDALLERHLPGLRAFVHQKISPRLLSQESSSDVVQSVCREVLQGAQEFQYQGEAAFRGWLYQTALRKLVDHQRHFEAQKRDGQPVALSTISAAEFALIASGVHSPSSQAMLREDLEMLERAFARLSETDQLILRLIRVDGLSHAQVAQRLQCSEENSRKQLSRALARLARSIA
jgi:RNA polymerase sigma-70 factor (ECF subfamily)